MTFSFTTLSGCTIGSRSNYDNVESNVDDRNEERHILTDIHLGETDEGEVKCYIQWCKISQTRKLVKQSFTFNIAMKVKLSVYYCMIPEVIYTNAVNSDTLKSKRGIHL